LNLDFSVLWWRGKIVRGGHVLGYSSEIENEFDLAP
jgi:hypothetical protein